MAAAPLFDVQGLTVAFDTPRGRLRAVDGVSFSVGPGEVLGLVGESGCGKSVTALATMRLLPTPPAVLEGGEVRLEGLELLALPERAMRAVRGGKLAMIFQEPMTSLNPVYTVGTQIVEAIRLHKDVSRGAARARAVELLRLVGIPDPEANVDAYPHELSGGMRQRVMIAMALSCEPRVLLADEPTTALDVTIQAQILELLASLRKKLDMAVVLITHDLGVVAEVATKVVVMYAGEVVEEGAVADVFRGPRHPYTKGLLESLPRPEALEHRARLPTIEGLVPDLASIPSGCRFADRCVLVLDACRAAHPALEPDPADPSHRARCIRADEVSP